MLYLSGIILSFFLCVVLITKRNKSYADCILAAWLGVIGFHLLTFYLFSTNQQFSYPTLVALGFPLPLAQGPFLYLYTRQQTSDAPFDKKQLLHFLPVLCSYLLFASFYFLPFDQKIEVFQHKGQGFKIHMLINLYPIFVSGILYVILSLVRLIKYRKNLVNQFSNTEKINFNWLLYLIIWMMVIWITILFTRNDKLIFGSVSLFVIWLGYFSIKQVQVYSQNTKNQHPESSSADDSNAFNAVEDLTENVTAGIIDNSDNLKYQKSALNEKDISKIYESLKHLMFENKPYTNPDLTLNDLAKDLKVHPNHLSQVINSKEHKNFYDLINERRVQEFKKLVSLSSNQKYTLMAIAYDCGFNSKASFNRNFKKYTGLTPSNYLQKHLEK